MCRYALALTSSLFLTACAGGGVGDGRARGGEVVEAGPVRGELTADIFPFDAPPARFMTSQRTVVNVRLEPTEGGTTMWIGDDGARARRIDWRQSGSAILCSDGPDRQLEFMRLGATPGTTWTSSGRTIRFDGWERVETPAGLFDAARISTILEVDPYAEVESWWFAPDIGLVRMRIDKGDLYSMEMNRIPPR